MKVIVIMLIGLACAITLGGCSEHQPLLLQKPAAILKDDISASCGMYIEGSPGPRGEAYVQGQQTPLKFGSTRDFLAYILQPENKLTLQHLFVQDSARIDWNHPSNAAGSFVDARIAYYVAWQPLPGSMGPTFASFAARSDATAFVNLHGGEIFRFDEITPELVASLGYICPSSSGPPTQSAQQCLKGHAELEHTGGLTGKLDMKSGEEGGAFARGP